MQYECSKHGMTEFTEPNANHDCFCKLCVAEIPECKPPHLKMRILEFNRTTNLFMWGGEKRSSDAAKT